MLCSDKVQLKTVVEIEESSPVFGDMSAESENAPVRVLWSHSQDTVQGSRTVVPQQLITDAAAGATELDVNR